ncbi:MAG: 5-(carboxyamino)imidazole ribonucleotide synthase [Dermatophilus congolensis]|nr:5-(carboxyamino)imidazole ribonucleotide synthase [Dermatophilus congolensis]
MSVESDPAGTRSNVPVRAPGGFPVVGIIGAGQLARMCQPPAVNLGITLSILSETDTASAALVTPSAPVGQASDVEAVRAFARHCDVVTFDHEHIPEPVLAALAEDGIPTHPRPEALRYAQDKLAMRELMTELGIGSPRWARVRTPADLDAFGAEVGWPVILKTPKGGYDGKGVLLVAEGESHTGEAAAWFEAVTDDSGAATSTVTSVNASGELPRENRFPDGLLAEEAVQFTRELAILVARSPSGQAAAWPVVETVQIDGICTEVLAPAPGVDADEAARITEAALRIAGRIGLTGVMAVELFEVSDASGVRYLVNELAMRPHNSGHWTIDGAVTSQFEQHLRAVLDLPLGDPSPRATWTVMGNVLGGEVPEFEDLYGTYKHLLARDPGLKMHLYGKGVRPGRKIGHVNVSGDDLDSLRERATHATGYLRGTIRE